MLLFIGYDDTGADPISCGGNEMLLSKPGSSSYKGCKASSIYRGTKCDDGFQNKTQDSKGSMWISKGEGVGAWIKIEFKDIYMITKFSHYPRANPAERNKEIELEFSNN